MCSIWLQQHSKMSRNHIAGSMWSACNMLASEPAWDPARSLFLSSQPLYNTKRSLRRRLNPPDFTYSLKKIIMTKWYLSQNQQHITPFSEKEEIWVNREFLTNWNPTNHSSVFFLASHIVHPPPCVDTQHRIRVDANIKYTVQPIRIRMDVAWVTVGHLSLVVLPQVSFLLEFYLGHNKSFCGGTVLLTT